MTIGTVYEHGEARVISQAKPDVTYHYDCTFCGMCSDAMQERDENPYPYFYIDGQPCCPNCAPAYMKHTKEAYAEAGIGVDVTGTRN